MIKKRNLLLLSLVILSVLFVNSISLAEKAKGNNYIIFYQATEYNSKLADSVDYIFDDMIKSEDQLTIFSPVKPYGFSQKTRQTQGVKKLIKLTKQVLKKDIMSGMGSYQQILGSMAQIITDIAGGMGGSSSGGQMAAPSTNTLKRNLVAYRQLLAEMHNLRKLNENLFLKLADMLKKVKNKAYIYIVYQKESKIIPDRKLMDAIMKNADIRFDAVEVFQQENTKDQINIEKVSKALKDSNVIFNFVYVNVNNKRKRGMEIKEFSGDIYSAFSKIAENTGGTVITTSKPRSALEKINKGNTNN